MLGLVLAQSDGGIGKITPADTLIGGAKAQELLQGLAFYGLLFCVVGVVLSAGLWAIGSFSSNYTQSVNGKKGFLVCAGAAVAIGAAGQLVSFFANAGGDVSNQPGG